ncbi:ferritin-like domain-containing protein [Salinimicrobium sp. CAU 1759]
MKTTRESAREESHKKVSQGLQELLEKNYDMEKDYRTARERAKDPALKDFFKKQAVKKNHFATEIDKQLHSLNEHPKDPGSTVAGLNRTWINLKSSLGKDTDKSLIEECLRGEKNSVEEYENKLRKNNFPPRIGEVLRKHLTEIRASISELKTIKNTQ